MKSDAVLFKNQRLQQKWGFETISNMKSDLKVGIYIPTLNKPDFVIRQVKYYASLKSPHPVYIGDNSDEKNAKILQEALKNFQNQLEIIYLHNQPQISQAECELNLVSRIKEKYAVFCGDDDFLIPNSLTKCANFLEEHSDYSLASGLAVSIKLGQPGPYGKIVDLTNYRRPEVLEEKAKNRLKNYLNDYHVTLFSVARTKNLTQDWELSLKARERSFQTEVMPGCLAIVSGKSKTLNCLSIIRQMHDNRQPSPDIFDWFAKPDWAETYKYFSEILTKKLAAKDDIDQTLALNTIKNNMWLYIQNHLVSGREQLKNNIGKYIIVKVFKKLGKKVFPPSKQIFYRYMNPAYRYLALMCGLNFQLKNGVRSSLPYEILQTWSAYYQDFKEVLKITKSP